MRWNQHQLTYCTNIHPVASASDLLALLRGPVRDVHNKTSPAEPMGLGLWFPACAVRELNESPEKLARLKKVMAHENFYLMTVNAFPYGAFHGARIKENVYLPDWNSPERLDYTLAVAQIVAELAPAGDSVTISTVPVAYGDNASGKAWEILQETGERLAELNKNRQGKIWLCFEPEPDCFLQSSDDCISFFGELHQRLTPEAVAQFGICFDTCHFQVEFEKLTKAWQKLEEAGIPIPKVQISSAVMAGSGTELAAYQEATYLHQTRVRRADGEIVRYPDLDQALAVEKGQGDWRVHFHVPLYSEQLIGGCHSTTRELFDEFLPLLLKKAALHLEIETYSFDVLPQKKYSITESIVREITEIRRRL